MPAAGSDAAGFSVSDRRSFSRLGGPAPSPPPLLPRYRAATSFGNSMSTGHRHAQAKSDAEMTRMLGEGDTPDLLARPVKLDTSHDIPFAGGISVDGRTVYIDRRLHADVMSGKIAVRGLTAKELIGAWIEHEHTEWAVDTGDNPVDSYGAAHAFALAKENHRYVSLGRNPDRVNDAVSPAIDACARRDPINPPRDLWCGPYLDTAFTDDGPDGKRAKELLRIFRAKGVADAFKLSKIATHYGMGPDQCRNCTHFGRGTAIRKTLGNGDIAPCEIVCGLVRADRDCDRFEEK
jgi:hypothetical protein